MKQGLTALLIITVIFGATYWYGVARSVCAVPITYRVGVIDERFGIGEEEVKAALSDAEVLWERSVGKDLFVYDAGGAVAVNFVYDERQQRTKAEENFREVLDEKEEMSESVRAEYDRLLKEYEKLKAAYEAQTAAYERKLATYNAEVADWNEKGGAPEDVFDRLGKEKETLATEQTRLNGIGTSLNTLVRKMNALSAQGNSLISEYNETAEEYNDRFSEGGEFTQGDYEQKVINIYEFENREELRLVLAHEFGHALSLDHVQGEDSIMYHLMREQRLDTGVTEGDRAEFARMCGDTTLTSRLIRVMREQFLAAL